ncbi:penicillin binding protein PBP4B [Fictibacillus gelatini]|uniref:penicillin binding protein PBP4B n=1 Tax=Fictibacillus gelatini TaxID=225985 RepID=UPI000418F64B|nr:penicillin binding protein PBP4B [Fictibacillus gelatini]
MKTYPVLTNAGDPEEAGFSAERLRKVDSLIECDVQAGFPGAVLLVVKDAKVVKHSAYGYKKKYEGLSKLEHPFTMEKDTMFDLASNTKMYALNFALQHLSSIGKVDLNARVQDFIPEFKDQPSDDIKGKNVIRIVDLLTHCAGFPADPGYYDPKKAGSLYSQDRERTLTMLCQTPLQYKPGSLHLYSDVDYMLLGYIIEKITDKRLDHYVENEIYKPLGLKRTVFNPLQKRFKQNEFAATELLGNTRDGIVHFPNIRTDTLQGEVHDEKAFYSMGGVSGHAGLFSTANDLAVLLQVMLNGGGYGDVKLFDQQTINTFIAPSHDPTFGLGWRRNGDSGMVWMFGSFASPKAIGHTGWTGTLTIIDVEYQLGIVLLTNKKHSPVLEPENNPNLFLGDTFETAKYGKIITAIYEALLRKSYRPGG